MIGMCRRDSCRSAADRQGAAVSGEQGVVQPSEEASTWWFGLPVDGAASGAGAVGAELRAVVVLGTQAIWIAVGARPAVLDRAVVVGGGGHFRSGPPSDHTVSMMSAIWEKVRPESLQKARLAIPFTATPVGKYPMCFKCRNIGLLRDSWL